MIPLKVRSASSPAGLRCQLTLVCPLHDQEMFCQSIFDDLAKNGVDGISFSQSGGWVLQGFHLTVESHQGRGEGGEGSSDDALKE